MKVLKILNLELGWDNVWILADSWESAAFSAERESVEEFKHECENDEDIIFAWVEVDKLPETTFEESKKKHWDEKEDHHISVK
tara:strand:+ start:270 stop:518 length:249 start_codon:yes stop_codon:yes gene_type:complete